MNIVTNMWIEPYAYIVTIEKSETQKQKVKKYQLSYLKVT